MAHYSLTPDITGKRFGRWTVIRRDGSMRYGGSRWLCRCDCGNEKRVPGPVLNKGSSTSCGCSAVEGLVARSSTHGLQGHPLYRAWGRMKERCYYEKHRYYADYGGRGIVVCDRWQGFEPFYEDNVSTWGPGLQLDRIDNDGHYSPDNCRWTDRRTQGRNKRNNVYLTHNGRTQLLMDWALELGIPANALRLRHANGWNDAEAITTPYKGARNRP